MLGVGLRLRWRRPEQTIEAGGGWRRSPRIDIRQQSLPGVSGHVSLTAVYIGRIGHGSCLSSCLSIGRVSCRAVSRFIEGPSGERGGLLPLGSEVTYGASRHTG